MGKYYNHYFLSPPEEKELNNSKMSMSFNIPKVRDHKKKSHSQQLCNNPKLLPKSTVYNVIGKIDNDHLMISNFDENIKRRNIIKDECYNKKLVCTKNV